MVKRIGITGLLCLLLPGFILTAEITSSLQISCIEILTHNSDDSFGLSSLAKTRLDLSSNDNKNVKGGFQLDALIADAVIYTIPRAFIKVRFPEFRLMIGKNRVSWGEGIFFNAGDIVFDTMSLTTDLSASVLRDDTKPMAVITRYLDSFSFIDLIYLAQPKLTPPPYSLETINAGARIVAKLWDTSIEAGYLYKGDDKIHRTGLSLHTSLFGLADAYMAGSCTIDRDNPQVDAVINSIALSAGLFSSIGLTTEKSLSIRLESGIYPSGHWEELEALLEGEQYGLYLFPEISLPLFDNMVFQLRSIISPVDLSGVVFSGISINPYQGLTFSGLISCMFGETKDQFGWGKNGDFTFTLYVQYLFGGKSS